MKWAKIKQLCVSTGIVDIVTIAEDTWIGNGFALWRVDDGIEINKDNVAAMLDLNEKQVRKMRIIDHTDGQWGLEYDSVDDTTDYNLRLKQAIIIGISPQCMMLCAGASTVMIDTKLLGPVYDTMHMDYMLRQTRSGRYMVAVYNSMMCCALLLPMQTRYTDDTLTELRTLSEQTYALHVEAEDRLEKDGAEQEAMDLC